MLSERSKVLIETGGEVSECGASKVKEAVAGDESPGRPEALTPDVMELKQSRDLVELYRRLAKLHVDSDVGGLAAACDRLVIEIERFDDGRSRLSAADIEAAATALEAKRPEAAKVQAAIAQVQADLATRLNDVRMRRTLSDGPEVLKDIWTRWLAANPGKGAQRADSRGGRAPRPAALLPRRVRRAGRGRRPDAGGRGARAARQARAAPPPT